MSHNLAARERTERDKVIVNLSASGGAYRERLKLPGGNDPVYQKEPKD